MELPALHRAAAHAARVGQRRVAIRTALHLTLLIIAALGGVIDWRIRDGSLDLGGALSASAFLAALVIALAASTRAAEETWHRGRALAESIRTLAWRYAVCGDPSPRSAKSPDEQFARVLKNLLENHSNLVLPPMDSHQQITADMKSIRAMTMTDRRRQYLANRINPQLDWYAEKALFNRARTQFWTWCFGVAALVGVVLGALRAVTLVRADYVGILAALAAAFSAWMQVRQYQTLATSYSVAAQELALSQLALNGASSEGEWARAVVEAESTITREHMLWIARKGATGSI